MNVTGPQPMKQQTDKLINDINQMTVYRPDKPTDLFQFYHPQIRKHFIDAYNLCRIWVQSLLYWKGLYPKEAFELKTAYSRKVYVVKSKMLREYLDKFFESVCQNFEYVDFIQIYLFEQGQERQMRLMQIQKFYFNFTDKFSETDNIHQIKRKGLNTIQKQMQFKRFLGKMEQQLTTGYICPLNRKCTFRLLMGYKWQQKNVNNKHRMNLLHKWTQSQSKIKQEFVQKTINQAGTQQLQVICQRYEPVQNARLN